MRKLVPVLLVACLIVAAIVIASCSKKEPEAPATSSAPPAADASPLPPPEVLRPVISPSSTSRLPEQVVIQFARPVAFAMTDEGAVSDDTVIDLDPSADGALTVAGPSALLFTPEDGFKPEKTYTVRLEALALDGGIVKPPAKDAWAATFTTPAFKLDRALLTEFHPKAGEATIELTFTGPVESGDVASRASLLRKRAGSPDARVALGAEATETPSVVLLRVRDASLRVGDELAFELAKGVKLVTPRGYSAPAASASMTLVEAPLAPEVVIRAAYPSEGTNGFFVEIVCDDASVKERRWYWDPATDQGFGEISARCNVNESDLAEKLRFDPPVAFTTAPSAGGVRVFGDFKRGSYELSLDPGARTKDGGWVRRSFATTISVPARKPRVSFVSKGRYLPREQWRSLPFRSVNVDTVEVTIRHVPAENLVFWASADDETTSMRDSDVLTKARVAVRGEPDQLGTSWLDVGGLVPASTRGLLEITLAAGEATDSARLVLTDLQLVAKRDAGALPSNQGGDVRAWAFDAQTLEPARGATVDLVRPSGQVVATGTTDASGEVLLKVRTPAIEQEAPFALVARKDKDVTYLAFDEVQAEVADEQTAGEPWRSDVAWRAAVYTDRGAYRPGETAHVAAIVRGADYGPAPAGMPGTLTVVDPRGQVLRQVTLPVSATGFVTADVEFADFATTGRHEVQLSVADKQVAVQRFHVEEFVPERMKVEVVPQVASALAGDPVGVAASARYLFGGVPADHRAELTCTVESSDFKPKENANFAYGTWREDETSSRTITLGTASGALDAEGKTELQCPVTEPVSLSGPGRLIASVAVFEAGSGRTTVNQAAIPLHPERFYVGLSSRQSEAKAGQALAVDGIVVDWDGKPVGNVTEVELSLVRLENEYGWYYDEEEGTSSHRRYMRPVADGSVKAKVSNGRFQATLTPTADAAAFLVRATAGKARTDLRLAGAWGAEYWDDWGPGRIADRTPRPSKPTWIAIDAPKVARVGEPVEVKLTAAHRGRLLLTVEAEGVIERQWKDVEAGPLTWSFKLKEFRPNVYVTALLVKPPHLESKEAFLPDRSYGVVSVPVEPTRFVLPVKMKVPDEVRSGQPLKISLDLGPLDGPAQVTVAAVDEGILSLTKFPSPDPLPQVFTRRGLGVVTYETVGWTLLSSPPPPAGQGSGDEALSLARVQSVKPVALWSGLLDVPKSGKLDVTLDVPTYRGALRVMAVAATAKKMGSASATVIVRDPLSLQVTLPRFLSEGDVAQVPVFVTNTSGASRSVSVDLTAEDMTLGVLPSSGAGPQLVQVAGSAKALELKDGESGTALFTLRVKGKAGATRLLAVARSGDLQSHDEIEVPLTPTGARVRMVQRVELEQGRTVLTSKFEGWEALSETSSIRVTPSPYGDAFDHLKYLIHYPYGCIEQTTSSVRPLLSLQGLVSDIDPKILATGGIEAIVRAGIARIGSMQAPSGGFSYWPGGREEAYWGSAYATHFLLDAQAAGYAVPQDRIDKALAWMEDRITNHFEKGRGRGDWYSEDAEPYMHFVLAKAGRGRPARAEALLNDLPGYAEDQKAENRFMLQAALYMSGDRRFEKELRATDVTPIRDQRRNDWSFYSDRRRRGFMLATHVDLFGADAGAEKLANLVAEGLRAHQSGYYTTQEIVWGVTGLSRFTGAGATFAPPQLQAGGKMIEPLPRPAGATSSERAWSLPRASERGEIAIDVPTKGEGKLYAVIASEGVREGAKPQLGGEGLRVERTFVDAAGVPVDPASGVALGDVVNIVLAVTNTTRERIANVALVSRIPAGWEIENPRLGRGTALDWLPEDAVWNADHLDVRDDRLEVFGHLESGETKKVAFAARAVTAGRFTMPPAEAEAMYDPSQWARAAGEVVTVSGPWEPVAQ